MGLITPSLALAQTQALGHVQIAQRNIPAIVAVNVLQKDTSTLTGTGFIIAPNGLLATNLHLVKDSLYTNVTFSNGVLSGEAELVAQDTKTDLALLKIEAQHLPYVTLSTTQPNQVWPGQTITVIGNPRRLQNTVSSGIISQLRPQKDGTLWHQISAPISPSSSGSPVFNDQGNVIGVVTASLAGEGNQNLNFAIPAAYLTQLVEQAGFTLPVDPTHEAFSQNPFIRHVQKAWQITKRLLHRWYHRE